MFLIVCCCCCVFLSSTTTTLFDFIFPDLPLKGLGGRVNLYFWQSCQPNLAHPARPVNSWGVGVLLQSRTTAYYIVLLALRVLLWFTAIPLLWRAFRDTPLFEVKQIVIGLYADRFKFTLLLRQFIFMIEDLIFD